MVEVLLRNEAVTNIADCKGCFPLHLAAWKGDAHIVRLLIHHGPSHAKVNEQVFKNNSYFTVNKHSIFELYDNVIEIQFF